MRAFIVAVVGVIAIAAGLVLGIRHMFAVHSDREARMTGGDAACAATAEPPTAGSTPCPPAAR